MILAARLTLHNRCHKYWQLTRTDCQPRDQGYRKLSRNQLSLWS